MNLDTVRTIAAGEGPFITVYLERRSPSEDAATQLGLRWRALRDQLTEAGAAEEPLAAVDAVLTDPVPENITEIQTDGRVLVADGQGVLLNEPWEADPGTGDRAELSDVPALGAYARGQAAAVRVLVTVTDQTGAVLRQVAATEDRTIVDGATGTEVTGGSNNDDVHKPRQGALSHNQIQRSADETVKQNARGIADRISEISDRWGPDVILLAGETQGRTAVLTELEKQYPALAPLVQETDDGGSTDTGGGNAADALAEVIGTVAGEVSAGARLAQAERFEQASAHDLAVTGARAVAQAAEMGAVETLLLEYEDHADDEDALLIACAQQDADMALTAAPVADHVAAVLRFEAPAELRNSSVG